MNPVEQQMLHEATQSLYLNVGLEVLPGSEKWDEFQSSADPTVLGYTFVGSYEPPVQE